MKNITLWFDALSNVNVIYTATDGFVCILWHQYFFEFYESLKKKINQVYAFWLLNINYRLFALQGFHKCLRILCHTSHKMHQKQHTFARKICFNMLMSFGSGYSWLEFHWILGDVWACLETIISDFSQEPSLRSFTRTCRGWPIRRKCFSRCHGNALV